MGLRELHHPPCPATLLSDPQTTELLTPLLVELRLLPLHCCGPEHARFALHSEPIAVALGEQGVAVMQQPIEDRRSEDVIAEDLAPLTDKLVGGDEKAALLVAASDELEEEMRRSLLEGQIAELVEDEELGLGVESELVGELAIELGAGERAEQRGGAGEKHRMTRLDDGASEGDGEVGLADPWRSEEQHILQHPRVDDGAHRVPPRTAAS